jgi:hypothetical protein
VSERTCSIPECQKEPKASHGWCWGHYQRWLKYGDPTAGGPPCVKGLPLDVRFWARVDRRGPDECWPWKLSRNDRGYGKIKIGGKDCIAHRTAYSIAVGPIPDGLLVCHTCDNPPCCNPAHLFVGTSADNNADMKAKGRAKGAPKGRGNGSHTRPDRRPHGERNGQARLTDDEVAEVRRLAPYFTRAALGERFGVSHSHITRIVNRQTRVGHPW